VTAVGGKGLFITYTGSFQDVWADAGSGCSKIYPKPTWRGYTLHEAHGADVSAVGDPTPASRFTGLVGPVAPSPFAPAGRV